jgi:hypothetical protein
MTRKQIKEAIGWNSTDIDNAKDALITAKMNLRKARACRVELLTMLRATNSSDFQAFKPTLAAV